MFIVDNNITTNANTSEINVPNSADSANTASVSICTHRPDDVTCINDFNESGPLHTTHSHC